MATSPSAAPVDDDYLAEVEAWRSRRIERLTGPDGWLAIVGLAWLHEGSNTMGADPSCDVVLPTGKAPPHVGAIEVAGRGATAVLDPSAGVTHDGRPVGRIGLRDDLSGAPTVLRLGPLSIHVIRREGALAVRIRDAESQARTSFRGIPAYPVDPRWRRVAVFEPYRPERFVPVRTVLDTVETYRIPGAVAFDLDGSAHRLDAFLEPGETDLFVAFGDATNGRETFGGGRYLYAAPPGDDGLVVIDFNRCYNPPCVFTPHATCPLPLPQNRLPVPVFAGEKAYGAKG